MGAGTGSAALAVTTGNGGGLGVVMGGEGVFAIGVGTGVGVAVPWVRPRGWVTADGPLAVVGMSTRRIVPVGFLARTGAVGVSN
jgi:hypothetical protein